MRLFIISLGMVLFSFIPVNAQEQTVEETKVEQLEEIILTAQYVPISRKNAVYKVKTISAKTIERKAVSNIRELLSQELNIELSQNSVFGTSIEIQGISKENVKILIDGTPVVGRLDGMIDLNQITTNNIERVEIIEGPVSVFYGTDAMGGVINLITKQDQEKTFEGSVTAYYESINATRINADLGYDFGEDLLRINAGQYHFKGLSTNDDPRRLNWEERLQHSGDVVYVHSFDKLKLRYNGHISNEKLVSIGEPDRFGNITDTDYFTRRINNTLNLQGKLSSSKFLDATASFLSYRRYHDDYDVDPDTFESTLSTTDTKDNNTVKYQYGGLKMQLGRKELDKKINYAFGYDVNFERSEGERILDKKKSIETVAVFGSLNFNLFNNVEVQPAMRYTWNNVYGNLLSPAFNSKIKINNNNIIRFSYARGFRAPSIKELYLDFRLSAGPFTYEITGNKDLEVEKSHNFNLYYTLKTELNKDNLLTIEPSLFYNDISNLIVLSELVDFKRNYININKFKSLGGRINLAYNPTKQLLLKAGFSIVGKYNEFKEDFDTEEFLYTPEVTSHINYEFDKANLGITLYHKYTGKRDGFYIDTDTDELKKITRESFNNLDLTVSKSFFKKSLKTSVGVKNIFDIENIETLNEIGEAHSSNLQLWGRSFFVRTSYNF